MRTYSYGGKHPSTNMEVRSKKLEVRNAAHALMNANNHLDARTCTRTDGRTPSRTRACKHTNACTDGRRLVRSNIWTHEHARGQTRRQMNGRTDGLTYTQSRTRACTHTNGSMLTRTHDALRYIRTDGEPYAHMFVLRQTPKYKHGS